MEAEVGGAGAGGAAAVVVQHVWPKPQHRQAQASRQMVAAAVAAAVPVHVSGVYLIGPLMPVSGENRHDSLNLLLTSEMPFLSFTQL